MKKASDWSHVTLTFEQNGKTLSDYFFRRGVRLWSKLRKRIIRKYKDIRYIQTWEVHRSGWPHLHIALSNADLFDLPKAHPKALFNRYLGEMAVECGFGPHGWLEPLRDRDAFAGYLVKLARELTGAGKKYQVPVNAPKNFRRLRASQRLLPPPYKDPDLTGCLQFCSLGEDWENYQSPLSIQE